MRYIRRLCPASLLPSSVSMLAALAYLSIVDRRCSQFDHCHGHEVGDGPDMVLTGAASTCRGHRSRPAGDRIGHGPAEVAGDRLALDESSAASPAEAVSVVWPRTLSADIDVVDRGDVAAPTCWLDCTSSEPEPRRRRRCCRSTVRGRGGPSGDVDDVQGLGGEDVTQLDLIVVDRALTNSDSAQRRQHRDRQQRPSEQDLRESAHCSYPGCCRRACSRR